MTVITPSELKVIYIQIVFMAITGFIFELYMSSTPSYPEFSITDPGSFLSYFTQLPAGLGDLAIVTAVVMIPLSIINALTALRLIRDFTSL